MNTPPPPLQPIADDAINGLYNYFGTQNNPPPQLRLMQSSSIFRINPNLNSLNRNVTNISMSTSSNTPWSAGNHHNETLTSEIKNNEFNYSTHMQTDDIPVDHDLDLFQTSDNLIDEGSILNINSITENKLCNFCLFKIK